MAPTQVSSYKDDRRQAKMYRREMQPFPLKPTGGPEEVYVQEEAYIDRLN